MADAEAKVYAPRHFPPFLPPFFSAPLRKHFSSPSQLCEVLTAALAPYGDSSVNRYLPENCCVTACVSKSPSKRWGVERGGSGDRWNVCLRACMGACMCFSKGVGGGRKEKLARENKVNEAWRRLPSPALGRGRRTSSFTVTTTPGGKDRKWQPWRGVVVVYAGWWKNSQAVTGFHLFIWSGSCCCWLRKHLTAQDSNALPQCSSRH